PRLLVAASNQPANDFWSSAAPFADCCTVGADDFYPTGNDVESALVPTEVYAGVQHACTLAGIQSAVVLQAFNWNQYSSPTCSVWPGCATYPTPQAMHQQLVQALSNMTPRLVLWYSYHDIVRSSDPAGHWADLQAALQLPVSNLVHRVRNGSIVL